MFQNGLICTDFSDGLHRLVNFIPDLARNGFKRIVFMHSISVWQDGKATGIDEAKIVEAKKRLSPALQSIPDGIEVKIEVLSGQSKEKILQLIDTYSIDVVFTGMSIRSSLEAKFLGSNTLELACRTSIPLMILRPQLISTYTCEELTLRCQHLWRYLLIPYNGGQSARYLIDRLKEVARNRPENSFQQCLLLWVIDDGGREKTLTQYHIQEAQQKLEIVKAELEELNLIVETQISQGNPLHEILNAALNFDISAIAIAWEYRSQIVEWTAPSLAHEILRSSWFPLLFFPPKK